MLGHIMQWFYSGLGGISQTNNSIAYSEVKIEPQLVGDINSVNASFESPYGVIESSWNKTEQSFNIAIPVNSSAQVILPVPDGKKVYLNDTKVRGNTKNGKTMFSVGSGRYEFTLK